MKKVIFLLIVSFFLQLNAECQDDKISGKPVAEIFTNFHYYLSNSEITNGFDLKRAYLGYEFFVDNHFSGRLVIDAGSPEDLPEGSVSKRYALYREASINYFTEKLKVSTGIVSTNIFTYQQGFWGKRYIAKPFQGINGYGYVADLGIIADYKVSEKLEFDFALLNGKGHSSLQPDNSIKVTSSFTISPVKNIFLRFYGDYIRRNSVRQLTFVGFTGLKTELFYIGGEFSYKKNLDLVEGHHAWGFSSTGGISLTEKTEFFARYDYSTSVIPDGEYLAWNYLKDGTTFIVGLQYIFNKNIKMAVDYQSFYPIDSGREINDGIFLNAIFKL